MTSDLGGGGGGGTGRSEHSVHPRNLLISISHRDGSLVRQTKLGGARWARLYPKFLMALNRTKKINQLTPSLTPYFKGFIACNW